MENLYQDSFQTQSDDLKSFINNQVARRLIKLMDRNYHEMLLNILVLWLGLFKG